MLNRLLLYLKDLCFPASCVSCGQIVESEGLCSECWKQIKWISDPKCKICGAPFEFESDLICGRCAKEKPRFDKAVAAFEYDDFSKNMIIRFKHGDSTRFCRQLATWTYRAGEEAIRNADLVVPVPIHFLKRLKRKYNQSELLAREIAKLAGVAYEPRILRKKKRTPQQEGLSRNARLKNVGGSFGVSEKYADLTRGRTIVLVDDVTTTGATANECAKVLKKNGAEKVILLTVARVDLK